MDKNNSFDDICNAIYARGIKSLQALKENDHELYLRLRTETYIFLCSTYIAKTISGVAAGYFKKAGDPNVSSCRRTETLVNKYYEHLFTHKKKSGDNKGLDTFTVLFNKDKSCNWKSYIARAFKNWIIDETRKTKEVSSLDQSIYENSNSGDGRSNGDPLIFLSAQNIVHVCSPSKRKKLLPEALTPESVYMEKEAYDDMTKSLIKKYLLKNPEFFVCLYWTYQKPSSDECKCFDAKGLYTYLEEFIKQDSSAEQLAIVLLENILDDLCGTSICTNTLNLEGARLGKLTKLLTEMQLIKADQSNRDDHTRSNLTKRLGEWNSSGMKLFKKDRTVMAYAS